jgi:site-specific DNA-cytosine methylase
LHSSPPCQKHSAASAANWHRWQEDNKKQEDHQEQQQQQQQQQQHHQKGNQSVDNSISNPAIVQAVERFVLSFQPAYFTVEQVAGFFVDDCGKHLFHSLKDNGYNVQIVTMQAALHDDEDYLGNILWPLSGRVRSILFASRKDFTTIQMENPLLRVPDMNHFLAFGTTEVQQLIRSTKLETSNTNKKTLKILDLPDNLRDRFSERTTFAGIQSIANNESVGHVPHPTKYKLHNRTEEELEICRISGRVSNAILTTPTNAGKTPNEVLAPYQSEKRTITPAEAAVMMGVTNLNPKDSLSRQPPFYIVLENFNKDDRDQWDQAFKGVGNGVPIGMGRAIGAAVSRAAKDSENKCKIEKNRRKAGIRKRKKDAKEKQKAAAKRSKMMR